MDARFYNSEDIDIERLGNDLVQAYLAQGYKAQQMGGSDQVMVQLKKGGDFEAILGMQAALTVTIQRTTGGVLAQIGQQRWIDKAAVGAVGIAVLPVLWPLAVTAGVGAVRQASLANQVLNMVDGLVHQQRPGISAGPIPSYLLPHVQQQWGPPPSAEQPPAYLPPAPPPAPSLPAPKVVPSVPQSQPRGPRCTHCNTPYEPGDTFCSGCGRPLTAPKLYCPNCNSELKPGIAFCPKCGANTFSTQAAATQPPARPAPAYTPPPPTPQVTYVPAQPDPQPPTPVYQPPKPATPVYTPPPAPPTPVYQPPKPQVPVYTPPPAPPKPAEPAYVPPAQQQPKEPANPPAPQVTYVPSQQPQQPTPPPKKEEKVYYVPSQSAQQPPAHQQPRVTVVPAKEEPPPPKPRPQKQYYIPSNQAQLQPTLPATPAQPTPAAPAVAAQPSQPQQQATGEDQTTADPYASWGSLVFADDQRIALTGDHAVVGRYDHDLGGIQPEVDLAQMNGADTVSRVHASIEHSGSSYTLTDLNSTNATRLNGKRLEPDKATPIQNGDTLQFGKISCTFKTA